MIESLLKIGQLYDFIVVNYPDEKSDLDLVICEVTIDVIAEHMSIQAPRFKNVKKKDYDAAYDIAADTIEMNASNNFAEACSNFVRSKEAKALKACLDSYFHEMRHAWQAKNHFSYYFGNGYFNYSDNKRSDDSVFNSMLLTAYRSQACEQDAIKFAAQHIAEFVEEDSVVCEEIAEAILDELEEHFRLHLVLPPAMKIDSSSYDLHNGCIMIYDIDEDNDEEDDEVLFF